MAAKRTGAARAKPRGKLEEPQPASPLREIMESQLDLWRRLNTKEGTDVGEATKEMAPLVAEHWAKIFDELSRSAAMMQTSENPLAIQEGLPKHLLANYNEMLKRVFLSKSFAARSGSSVRGLLEGVKAWNEAMDGTLKAMRIPSKADIDEIHEELYNLSKRVDYLVKSLENGGARGRRERRR
jgi:hypothetical protein